MKILCIDTSHNALSVSIVIDNAIFLAYNDDCQLKHSQTLLAEVENLMINSNVKLADMDCFCASIGPGSFTGIRIGVTTVRAFAQVFQKPVIAVNSLSVKAYNVKTNHNIIVPLIDAMQQKVYYSAFDALGKEILGADICLEKDVHYEVSKKLNVDEKEICFVYEKKLDDITNMILPEVANNFPKICKGLFLKGQTMHYSDLKPFYAVLSQAEKNYADRNK